ncbi:hypothetical protein [Microvirga massiliensis]|uniref:hypothetical protein n=1 Tax=Microvirga massiliensis TaxID=1033741 RepID=UPI00062BE9E4|nr:hypothetical protein [Microvirga massiliensis]
MTTQTLDEIMSGQGEALSDAASPELPTASDSTPNSPEQSDFGKQLADANAVWERRFSEVLDAVRTPRAMETSDANIREQVSQMMAVEKHGSERVEAAYQALANAIGSDPQVQEAYRRIMAAPHPYGELLAWHEQQQVLSEIGRDPRAYREKLRAELLAELQNGAPRAGHSPGPMPSNFAQGRSAGPRSGVTWNGPQPLSAIMKR